MSSHSDHRGQEFRALLLASGSSLGKSTQAFIDSKAESKTPIGKAWAQGRPQSQIKRTSEAEQDTAARLWTSDRLWQSVPDCVENATTRPCLRRLRWCAGDATSQTPTRNSRPLQTPREKLRTASGRVLFAMAMLQHMLKLRLARAKSASPQPPYTATVQASSRPQVITSGELSRTWQL